MFWGSRGKMEYGGKWNTGCLGKSMQGVDLLLCQSDFCYWSGRPLIARFMGPTCMGPSGADRTQVGPMLAPWTLLSGAWHIKVKLVPHCKYYTNIISPFSSILGDIYYIYIHIYMYIYIDISILTFRCRVFQRIRSRNHWMLLNRIFYLFYVFSRHFDRANCTLMTDMAHYIQTWYRGLNETWYVGVKWHFVGKTQYWNAGRRLLLWIMSQNH